MKLNELATATTDDSILTIMHVKVMGMGWGRTKSTN